MSLSGSRGEALWVFRVYFVVGVPPHHLKMYISRITVPHPMSSPMIILSLRRRRPIMVIIPFKAGICEAVVVILFATLVSVCLCERKSVRVA